MDEKDEKLGMIIDDLSDILNFLRENKQYAQSDRVRTIMGRIARLRPPDRSAGPTTYREIARSWPDPLLHSKEKKGTDNG